MCGGSRTEHFAKRFGEVGLIVKPGLHGDLREGQSPSLHQAKGSLNPKL
jgi:hypothetical protein